MSWWPYVDQNGQCFPLHHVHPFRYDIEMEAQNGRPAVTVTVNVGFGMHCFTRGCEPQDQAWEHYSDERETRTFCHDRYGLSHRLPDIARTLVSRQCFFARDDNFVTIDISTNGQGGQPEQYGVFFNVKLWKKQGPNNVLLVIQSAYKLSSGKSSMSNDKIRFKVLLGHALRNTKPQKQRRR